MYALMSDIKFKTVKLPKPKYLKLAMLESEWFYQKLIFKVKYFRSQTLCCPVEIIKFLPINLLYNFQDGRGFQIKRK